MGGEHDVRNIFGALGFLSEIFRKGSFLERMRKRQGNPCLSGDNLRSRY